MGICFATPLDSGGIALSIVGITPMILRPGRHTSRLVLKFVPGLNPKGLDGAAGAGGGFEDVSKPDGHHALVGAEVTRLKVIWISEF
jgi:hypothetical protein